MKLLKPSFTKLIILYVILNSTLTNKQYFFFLTVKNLFQVRYLVAYTSTGRIFYISPCFRPTRTIEGIFRATPVARKLAMYPTYIFYKDGDYHIRSDRRKSLNTVITDKISQDYLNKLYRRLTLHFRVLDDVFPEYMLGEWQGKGKFLDKLLRVCCYLANVILAQQGALWLFFF